jgi:LEA14-like dessication related protein
MRLHRAMAQLATAMLATTLFACDKPEPPTLTPEAAKVKAVSPKGVELELTIEVDNPNSVPLRARSVTADVTVGTSVKLGEVTVEAPLKVPAKDSGTVTAPLSLDWQNAAAIAVLAATRETVPFTVEGTANVGVGDVRFDVPFKTDGKLTRAQLMSLGAGAAPIPIPTALPKVF